MWKHVSLIVLAIGCLSILFEAENTEACKWQFITYHVITKNISKFIFKWLLNLFVKLAVKCYYCHPRTSKDVCPNEGRGELKTCVEKTETTCWKLVAITTENAMNYSESDVPAIGESRRKGCGQLGAFGPTNFDKSLHPGCQPHNKYRHYCSCDTDRCNDEGKMVEYLTESKSK